MGTSGRGRNDPNEEEDSPRVSADGPSGQTSKKNTGHQMWVQDPPLVALTNLIVKRGEIPEFTGALAIVHSADFGWLWPEFCRWMLSDYDYGMERMCQENAEILDDIRLLHDKFVGVMDTTHEREWRELRGRLGAAADAAWSDYANDPKLDSANARAAARPIAEVLMSVAACGANCAWAAYATPSEQLATAVQYAVSYACDASGWWAAQLDWNKTMTITPKEAWAPGRVAGAKAFATAAAMKLITIVRDND